MQNDMCKRSYNTKCYAIAKMNSVAWDAVVRVPTEYNRINLL